MRKVVAVMQTTAISEAPKVRAKVIADRYDVSERCVFQWKDRNLIPFIQVGKTIRFDLEAVIAAIEGKGSK
jgi:hypothetical protein